MMYTTTDLIGLIQTAVQQIPYPMATPNLFEPIRYTLAAGGKRIRPTLVLMAANLFTDNVTPAITPAVGLEMYHNFTLLHDDVMDKADERRGRATVHVKWNDNTAILSGDAMQGLAYQLIATAPAAVLKQVLDLFTQTNIEICEGQQMDMEFETRKDVTTEEYIEMIRLKTAVLLGCALKMGAYIGGANENDAQALYKFGQYIGLAFQLQDDWLDCYGDPKTFGKRIGGDICNNKKTFLLINALKLTSPEQQAIMLRELTPETAQMSEVNKIDFFTSLYKECGAELLCREKIEFYNNKAMESIAEVSIASEKCVELITLAQKLLHRNV